ncbi:MAG TPA: hypothetical protein VFB66_09095 [Tepidisphaeraceae bacterium]|nr:hypothetical protein [Tepidisphaeraceae bacterium]
MRTPLAPVLLVIAMTSAAFAQAGDDEPGEPLRRTTTDTFDRPPDIRANEWPWEISASAGAAWVGDEDVDGSLNFAGQLRLGKYVGNNVSVVGSYLFALAETEIEPPGGGPVESSDHNLHVGMIGVCMRLDLTPEMRLFIEPRIGVIFGDADTGPAGGAAGGLELEVTDNIFLRFEALGLLADSTIDTDAGDADVDGIAAFTLGIVFEF